MSDTIEEVEVDILKKEYKDLSESEKAKIVMELTRFSLSDFWVALQDELKSRALEVEAQIETEVKDRYSSQLVASQFDRDLKTYEYMIKTVENLTDGSIGCTIFRNKLEAGAKQYRKQAMERIEAGYDAPCYSDIDLIKNERSLHLSVAVWLTQTINHYEKPVEQPEVQSAY